MDYKLQAKLLRFLEEGVIEPVPARTSASPSTCG